MGRDAPFKMAQPAPRAAAPETPLALHLRGQHGRGRQQPQARAAEPRGEDRQVLRVHDRHMLETRGEQLQGMAQQGEALEIRCIGDRQQAEGRPLFPQSVAAIRHGFAAHAPLCPMARIGGQCRPHAGRAATGARRQHAAFVAWTAGSSRPSRVSARSIGC